MATELGPERRLLLACAAPGGGLPPLEGVDWDRVRILAAKHRMTMLLARRLLGTPTLPARAGAWLTAEARAGSARALSMTAELARLMSVLEAAGVAAAAYKGPVLSVQAYGEPGLRWCSDLDLLVAPEDVPAAMAALGGAGYAAQRPLSRAQEASFRRSDGDYPLRHAATRTLVELHCHVSPPRFAFRFDTARLLRGSAEVGVGPFGVAALRPEDLLPALAVHGAKHRWARMEWLAAFAALMTRHGIAPAELMEAAARIRAVRAAQVALTLCRDLLAMRVGDTAAYGRSAAVMAEVAAARMLGDEPRYDARDTARNLRFNLQLCDSPADRLRTCWRWATVPSTQDWSAMPLPDALFPAYRLLRPLRLIGRYGPFSQGSAQAFSSE